MTMLRDGAAAVLHGDTPTSHPAARRRLVAHAPGARRGPNADVAAYLLRRRPAILQRLADALAAPGGAPALDAGTASSCVAGAHADLGEAARRLGHADDDAGQPAGPAGALHPADALRVAGLLQAIVDEDLAALAYARPAAAGAVVAAGAALRAVLTERAIRAAYAHEEGLLAELLKLGVRGYLRRSAGARAPVAAAPPAPQTTAALSGRELEIVRLAAEAMSNSQIGSRLSLTEATVKRHLHNVFRKLGAVSRLDAVNKARAAGLV
jgi:DNA-binding CsgD family transcriptional regulator